MTYEIIHNIYSFWQVLERAETFKLLIDKK